VLRLIQSVAAYSECCGLFTFDGIFGLVFASPVFTDVALEDICCRICLEKWSRLGLGLDMDGWNGALGRVGSTLDMLVSDGRIGPSAARTNAFVAVEKGKFC